MPCDLTVAVTAHSEDFLLRATLRSVAEALEVFVAAGHTAELLLTLDRASELTRLEAARWRDADTVFPVRVLEVDNGESGATRNSAVAASQGTHVALCDGDDLVSRNFFLSAFDVVTARDLPTVVHPEAVLSFGGRSVLWKVRSMDDPTLNYFDLIAANLWPSCSFAPRALYLAHPYPELKPGSGFGPEDYSWNIETATAGVPHVTAPDTVFFYRTRESGGVNNAHAASVLPAFSIDELHEGFPRSTPTHSAAPQGRVPLTRDQRLRAAVRRARPIAGRVARLVPRPLRAPLRRQLVHIYGTQLRKNLPPIPQSLRIALKDAAELEPAISWTAEGVDSVDSWTSPTDEFASVLEGLARAMSGTEVLLLAPWLGVGGADLVTVNYGEALAKVPALEGKVTLLTTYLPERTIPALLPKGTQHFQLDPAFRTWPLARQQRLIAQLMVLVDPRLIISINCFDFTNSLREYSKSITANTDVYLTLFAFDRIGTGGYPVNPITDDPQRHFLRDISGIITDNTVTASRISDILGVDAPFVKVHHQSAAVPAYDFDEVVKQSAAYYDIVFDAAHPFKVMWPHRLDKEKRPDTLLRIVQAAKARALPLEFHVFGQRVLNNGNDNLIPALEKLGVINHGAYQGGLPSLQTDDYHALLLTSESEGMPLVLVQSLLLGLPVVASHVGGVGDLIIHERTGLLTDGPDDIDGFLDALTGLMNSRDLRRTVIRGGYDMAAKQHGVTAFAERTAAEFGYNL